MTQTLTVWWDDTVVGALEVNAHGEMRFAYGPAWLADASRPALSFSLPKQEGSNRDAPYNKRKASPAAGPPGIG